MDRSGTSGLEELYRELLAELRQFAAKRLGDMAAAEDVVQEAFLRFQRKEGFEQIENPRSYLYTTVTRLVIDRAKLRLREGPGAQDVTAAADEEDVPDTQVDPRTPENYAATREDLVRLVDAISSLPPQAQRAYLLHKVQHLTYAEVAEQMGLSKSTVEKHMIRALRYLHGALHDKGDE